MGFQGISSSAVGGIVVPVDKLGLVAPYLGFALLLVAATFLAAFYLGGGRNKKTSG